MTVTVRRATPADYEAIGRLTVAAYRDDGQVDAGHPYESVLTAVADRAAAGELLVAERAGRLAGTVLYVRAGSAYAEISRPGEAEFRTLAVAPDAQGAGVGETLVRACLARARAHGCTAMVLSVREVAAAAQRLYARMGFVRLPERDWRPRPDMQLLAMRLPLAAAASAPYTRRGTADAEDAGHA